MEFQLEMEEKKYSKLERAFEKLKAQYAADIGLGDVALLNAQIQTLQEEIARLERENKKSHKKLLI